MDDTPAPASARAGLPGIVGGSKKLALGSGGGGRKKTSLADTILQESAAASVSRPAARKSLAVKVAPVEEDAWEEAAPPTLAPPSESVDLADSTELTAAAFTQPNEPLVVVADPEPKPPHSQSQQQQQGEISTWATMDDDADAAEETPPASAAPVKALSKEEKRAEMQRQREERKARMAAFKSGR